MTPKVAYPWFFFFRIARLSLLVFIPTLFLILILYRSSYKEGLIDQMSLQVEEDLRNTKQTLDLMKLSPLVWCESLPSVPTARYSIIDKSGKILCDTEKKFVSQNISSSDDLSETFDSGFGTEVRFSDHFSTDSLFGSLKFDDQLIVRKVIPISSLKDNLSRFDRLLFFRIIPFALISYFLFIFLFYRATKPLGIILSKVEKFKVDIPFDKTIKLLYQTDRWTQIEEALNEADVKLREQIKQTKQENEKIGAILGSIYDDIIAIDPFETILFYNNNFDKNFIKGRSLGEIIPKLWHVFSDENVLEAFRAVLKSGQKVSLKGKDFIAGRYFDLTVTPLKGENGKITGALGVFYDVTEFKLTEQMRVDFVANVSHEIRTPLTSIKGYAQVLQSQRNNMPSELSGFLDKILSNTERMIQLFNDLLNLSVIESKFELKPEEVSLEELVETTAQNIKTNYPHKKVDIATDIKLDTILGDGRLMEQVLSNLIDNACKYSESDSLAVKISSFKKDGKAFIVVSDNGPGISQEHQQRIFERFYRVDSSREASRGTGLGLSIVKHIIAKHGGKIWVESKAQEGSTFVIELPLE